MVRLGKSFDRVYTLRLPFLEGHVDIEIFFKKRSSFVLFNIHVDPKIASTVPGVKINMYKNLSQSLFCDLFIKLHSFKSDTLDIFNQFDGIKPEGQNEISYLLNEVVYVNKVETEERKMFDSLSVYAFTLNDYQNQYIFLLAERHHINTIIGKKIVRTTAIQVCNSASLEYLSEFQKVLNETPKRFVGEIDKVIKFGEENDK